MTRPMTKDELISHLATELNLPKTLINRLLTDLVATAIRETKRNGEFNLPGLGRLVVTHRKARTGRNPQTGETIKIPLERVVKLRLSSAFRVAALKKPAKNGKQPNYSVIRIFYATDRQPVAGTPLQFGSRRAPSGQLHLGTCDVSIPRDHRMAKVERPLVRHFEFREDPEKHFVIVERTPKVSREFYSELEQRVSISHKKEAFVFIHGFRVAFDEAVFRTAQIAYDLGFQGAPILYSWPSNGRIYEYTADINNNDWTVEHLTIFLRELAAKSQAKIIHLIAHSMGNRALTNALNRLASNDLNRQPPHFNQVVLTAPDIDADIFVQLANTIVTTADRITLYASRHDKALLASQRINGSYPRAGDCGRNVVIVPGVDTIDASAVDTNLVGHFYYAENRSVLSDVFNLFTTGAAPSQRFGIRGVTGPPPHWKFAP